MVQLHGVGGGVSFLLGSKTRLQPLFLRLLCKPHKRPDVAPKPLIPDAAGAYNPKVMFFDRPTDPREKIVATENNPIDLSRLAPVHRRNPPRECGPGGLLRPVYLHEIPQCLQRCGRQKSAKYDVMDSGGGALTISAIEKSQGK